jgi:hypothetical protein
MPDNKDQRYIRIAQACLRAINSAADSKVGRDEQIRAVYDAIDHAFQAELRVYRTDIDHLTAALERIAGGELNATEAQSLATRTLAAPERTQGGRQH